VTEFSGLLDTVAVTKEGLNGSCRICDFLLAAHIYIPKPGILSMFRVAESLLAPKGKRYFTKSSLS
jgi:hypothetical protein